MAPRIRIAVVYGGRSAEHPISVLSAGSVLAALDPAKYEVLTLGITRDGGWVRTEVEPRQLQITGQTLPEVLPAGTELALRPGSAEVAVFDAASAIAVLDSVDLVFPVLHGAYGEDGTIQGLLEMAGVDYVGSGVLASAAAMDKAFAKTMLAAAGLDVGRYLVLRPGDLLDERAVAELGLPLFVKPARAGSSIGISKVRTADELPAALKLAFEHDSKVLLEAAVAGREIECGVLQDADGTVSASLPAEIRLHSDYDWYSFEAKYLEDASDFDVPAEVGTEAVRAIQDASCRAFRALDCAGLARVDFFLTAEGRLVLNEVNTMPGFTAISMYPKMWEASGVSYPELLDRLIATALARRNG
ncbi:D-alanine--D-alanine ligase family protein [Jatrophihabitans sp.]|uniref:D-alanine--D-alanine ligase family protein n=1 Tax=Jatrophihabitans sp. TaxID=1932789 RepID=UPI002C92FB50|nr:D-alanine--D-alanine ligase family protein [Jatrophihabitans sp.]